MRFIIFYQFIRSSINDSKIELFTTEYEKFVNIVRDIFLKKPIFLLILKTAVEFGTLAQIWNLPLNC